MSNQNTQLLQRERDDIRLRQHIELNSFLPKEEKRSRYVDIHNGLLTAQKYFYIKKKSQKIIAPRSLAITFNNNEKHLAIFMGNDENIEEMSVCKCINEEMY